jgi:hypothetical protein
MDRVLILLLVILYGALPASADTYTWADDKGVVNFTDDPAVIPLKYLLKAKKSEDITIRSPKVQQELIEQENKARQEESNRPRISPTPNYVPPPPQTPAITTSKGASDELSPGRTKSQRIHDNIERRELEEKSK